MISTFQLALTSYVYINFTDFERTYVQLIEETKPTLDLANKDHRMHLLDWLNKWICRINREQFNLASESIRIWNEQYLVSLCSPDKSLWELSRAELGALSEAYENLRKRPASIIERNCKRITRTIGPTAASKILFALRPNAAVAWDAGMRKALRQDSRRCTYQSFLELVQTDLKELESELERVGVELADLCLELSRPSATAAQIVGEYYWMKMNKGVIFPGDDFFRRWWTKTVDQ